MDHYFVSLLNSLSTQAANMSILARFEVMMLGYVMGCVTAMYRSRLMTTKCRMEAVHVQTSTASQIEHQMRPKIQMLNT